MSDTGSENVLNAVNQQGSPLPVRSGDDPSETTRRAPSLKEAKAYLFGASHDGTYSGKHKTFRFSQKFKTWLLVLKHLLESMGYRSWIYKEGKTRKVYALETTAEFLRNNEKQNCTSDEEKIAYIRGYFDSEGGAPHKMQDRFYIQLCQKNYSELTILKEMIESIGIKCGKIHNPSKKVDPGYWRFYILAESQTDFIKKIGSWHPLKSKIFQMRMKI